MTKTQRRASGLAALLLALGGVLVGAAPAAAGDTSLTVSPETVQAGYLVGVTADCGDNTKPASVQSDAFGTVDLEQQGNVLTAAVLVPETTPAGKYQVELNCTGTNLEMKKEVTVVSAVQPPRGPATGFGGTATGGGGKFLLIGGIATIVAGAALGLTTARRRAGRAAGAGRVRPRR